MSLRAVEISIEVVNDRVAEFVDFLHSIRLLLGILIHETVIKKGQENDRQQLVSRLNKLRELSVALDAEAKYYIFAHEEGKSDEMISLNIRNIVYKISLLIPYFAGRMNKKITYNFDGESQNCIIEGPDLFEVIPYKIIENAVKYSPGSARIDVRTWRSQQKIFIEIESLGPELLEGEEIEIFERGRRGHWAKKLGVSGFGVGLSQVVRICSEVYGGKVSCLQDKSRSAILLNGIPYRPITFQIVIPV